MSSEKEGRKFGSLQKKQSLDYQKDYNLLCRMSNVLITKQMYIFMLIIPQVNKKN